MTNQIQVVTTIKEIYEKEIKSPNITVGVTINNEDVKQIEEIHQSIVKNSYDSHEIYVNSYDHKETLFNTRLEILPSDGEEFKQKTSLLDNIEAKRPEMKEESISFQVTKSTTYGVTFDIKYLTEEEKQTKISELEEELLERYSYSDGDIENELEYANVCDVDVDRVENEFYGGIEEHILDYDIKFGEESILDRRDSIYCYILDKTTNYIKAILGNKDMQSYSEYILETKNHVVLLSSEEDYEKLLQFKDEIIEISETDNFNKFLIIFEQLF